MTLPHDPADLTIGAAARALRDHTLSSAALTEACLARIARDAARLNAFITVTADLARAQAAEADRERAAGIDRGPLHGIPISLKDLIDLAGTPTTAASRVRAGHIAAADAPIVAHLRRVGAVIVGKTNLHEFAMGTTSEDSAFGPVRHPQDDSRSPGGSSGGSAVAVRTGMGLASIGSDTGGSIRIPSAVCGLVGLKPAFGEVSTEGVVPLSRSLDHVGPLARSVADAALLFDVLTGGDGRAGLLAQDTLSRNARGGRAQLTAVTPSAYLLDLLQPDVRASFDDALARLRAAGVSIGTADLPHVHHSPAIYLPIVVAEGAAWHAETLDAMGPAYTPNVRLRLEMGRYVPATDYIRAQRGRDVLRAEVDTLLAGADMLLLPTLPIVAPPIGAATVPVGDGREEPVRTMMLRLTQPFNLTGHPAMSIPMRAATDGLPCGLQIVARDTRRLLRLAHVCEGALHTHAAH